MKRYGGFTLIESLLVLLVVSVMLGLPYLSFHRWGERMNAIYFFSEFEAYYHRTQLSAMTSSMPCTIYVKKKEVIFIYRDLAARQQLVSLDLPAEVTTSADFSIQINGTSGNTKDMKSFNFFNTASKETVTYKIQLGSGKLDKEIQKL
ncbi:competence type IV pilus minor pilin ComGD [Vagococcus elongatus]|uniref:Prepilin-type cleavage/methylation domain-containing protein n=1 Tax=Vagococcus elongatus TaxID=180344 RepID=A0A430B148_9ENTE|nr:competence type IV pilus minor pilin ComGD [Vagococcus elongatus]RSU14036.1 hypothetical protein CBF29_03895 [Vagococcus elongatus]